MCCVCCNCKKKSACCKCWSIKSECQNCSNKSTAMVSMWKNLLRSNSYLGLRVVGRNDPELGAERPRNWGGSTVFGADAGRIDSGADRPVPVLMVAFICYGVASVRPSVCL